MSLLQPINKRYSARWLIFGAIVLVSITIPQPSYSSPPGPNGLYDLHNAFGPFDYYDPKNKHALGLVNGAHFSDKTHALKERSSWQGYFSDVDYTLRAFPNHPFALQAMVEYFKEGHGLPLKLRHRTPDEYFLRAIQFRPNNINTRILYGNYLFRKHKYKDAYKQYKKAVELDPNSADAHYDLGLLYTKIDKYDDALVEAHRAIELGHPLPGLKNILIRKGVWKPISVKQKSGKKHDKDIITSK